MGHVVSDKGVEVDRKKTEAVKNWPKPLTPTNICIFLGLTGYYRRFVEGFSSIAAPLTALMKKKVKFKWAETCEKSFQELKDRLTSAAVLTLPKCGENYTIYCDASRVGLVCVLMQGGKAIVVADALIRMSMGSTAHVEDEKKELVKDVHRLARLGVRLVDSTSGGVSVHPSSEYP
ncbi:uncharacterized mitochondrial protein AtMg00860-like [Solanum lycopersicum]|uniref:uncharacterized mitochondrial protein AtMg00860-like n=1 Tax=Solanum lycopersicum TaxID=4081 RepID=UPI003747E5B1